MCFQPRQCQVSERRVLPAARALLCARQSRLVLNLSPRQGTSRQDAQQSQDGQGNQHCLT